MAHRASQLAKALETQKLESERKVSKNNFSGY